MTEKDYINECDNSEINESLIAEIEALYKVKLPSNIKKYFSYVPDDSFCGGWRVLSSNEILNQKQWMIQDLVIKGIIPLIDVRDLDYICFIPEDDTWAIVHDGDGCVFKEQKELKDYLN